ncbi:hypothetical protein [Pseudanabaena sp. PCC 6802]|nr:hypothetical protein [Pseudanabaena sp. PCC 6802]
MFILKVTILSIDPNHTPKLKAIGIADGFKEKIEMSTQLQT